MAALCAPAAAVLQSLAMAPLCSVCLLLACIAHRRERGAWPWPGRTDTALWAALALAGWALLSAAWAPEPGRVLPTAAQLAGLVLLAAAAARAVREDDPAPHRRLGLCLVAGLVLGLLAAGLDVGTGNGLRMLVRGLRAAPPGLEAGLKPAASVMALLLPLVLLAPLPRAARWGLLGLGVLALALLPGRTAALAAGFGALVALLATLLPLRGRTGRAAVAAAFAAVLVLTPALVAAGSRPAVAELLRPSAVHRLLIWDFALERARERPLLGWGMEASRALPGGKEPPSERRLLHLGLGAEMRAWLDRPEVESMPLHPHSGPLQLRLELGWPGLLLGAALAGLLAFGAGPAALGALCSAVVTFLFSFGAWQPWWMATQALTAALAVGLAAGAGRAREVGPTASAPGLGPVAAPPRPPGG